MINFLGRQVTFFYFGVLALNVLMAGKYAAAGRLSDAAWCAFGAMFLAIAMGFVEVMFGDPPQGGARG